ncbi:KilA-N domain-containing protein [Sulfurimonas sediminis]|uniref:KilA-N domain-containing protein n=1 Tax=Sulfurimonas sediminis TaxID=2590020 RepID=A0A7M1B0L2_9BACT|nr:KilA-N domain-containing protein [Sulfurimonas sediminis]QOP43230.1 KilA-N domain-containing protein [Sulfurimonas sediminis]
MKNKIIVQDQEVSIVRDNYISLTDIAKSKNKDEPKDVVKNWLRNKNTIEFLGLWERINNKNFKGVEFDSFKNEAGLNSFTLSPTKWVDKTGAIGIFTKTGRYGGTYAHKDIAFEFASWISAEFKLFLIKEFQRLKEEEIEKQKLGWDIKRTLVKMNYHIHTDAIKNNLIPPNIAKNKIPFIYATEADLLNVALFGLTAKQWSEANPRLEGNMRDYATSEQLVVLANLENLNAQMIKQNISSEERLIKLNEIAIEQLQLLLKYTAKTGKLK